MVNKKNDGPSWTMGTVKYGSNNKGRYWAVGTIMGSGKGHGKWGRSWTVKTTLRNEDERR